MGRSPLVSCAPYFHRLFIQKVYAISGILHPTRSTDVQDVRARTMRLASRAAAGPWACVAKFAAHGPLAAPRAAAARGATVVILTTVAVARISGGGPWCNCVYHAHSCRGWPHLGRRPVGHDPGAGVSIIDTPGVEGPSGIAERDLEVFPGVPARSAAARSSQRHSYRTAPRDLLVQGLLAASCATARLRRLSDATGQLARVPSSARTPPMLFSRG